MTNKQNRKLAAILFADIAGYTALMQKDEQNASALLLRFQKNIEELIPENNGQIINFYGDGALCIFNNPLEAVRCAMSLQRSFQDEKKIVVPTRIGLHMGTVVFENEKIYGDSVNIASRIESMGVPGAVLFSKKIRDEIKNQPDINVESVGKFAFKNVEEEMEVFALANEGFMVPKREELKGKFESTEKNKNRKWLLAGLLAVAILALSLLVKNQWFSVENTAANPSTQIGQSIAVLPFSNLSADQEQEYFSLGISEQILHTLSQIEDLKVAGRTSSFSFKDKNLTIREIGNQLGVENILEGSVQKIGDRVQITAQLTQVADDRQFWSKQYQRGLTDIFALQNEIASDIAKELKLTLMQGNQPARKINPEAYDWLLKGNEAVYGAVSETDSAIHCYHRALQLEPAYAPIYTHLATAYYVRQLDGSAIPGPYLPMGIFAAQIATYHDPEDFEAKCLIHLLQFLDDWDWSHYDTVLSYQNTTKLAGYIQDEAAFIYSYLGEHDKAISIGQQLMASDPLNPLHVRFHAHRLMWARRFEEMLEFVESKKEVSPLFYLIEGGFVYAGLGNYEKAVQFHKEVLDQVTTINLRIFLLSVLAHEYARSGNLEMAQNYLNELHQYGKSYNIQSSFYSYIYGAMGDKEKAFEYIEKAIAEKDSYLLFMKEGFLWDPLRSDPRFQLYVERVFPSNYQSK